MMKTKRPTRTPHVSEPSLPAPIITAQGVASYITCARAWWLANIHELAPDSEYTSARTTLARRRQLARTLAIAGVILIVLAILLVFLGVVLG